MSKYDSLFEKGYYFGDTCELPFDVEKYNNIRKRIYQISNNVEEHYNYFCIVDDKTPHVVPYSQRQERINYAKEKFDGLRPYNSQNVLVTNRETVDYVHYFRDVIMEFIPTVFPHLKPGEYESHTSIQMYQEGDYQSAHSDGHVGFCVIIVYFSDPLTYNYSGRLEMLDGPYPETVIDRIDPIDGKFVIFDTENHNIRHRVEEVVGDFRRFSFLAQVRRC